MTVMERLRAFGETFGQPISLGLNSETDAITAEAIRPITEEELDMSTVPAAAPAAAPLPSTATLAEYTAALESAIVAMDQRNKATAGENKAAEDAAKVKIQSLIDRVNAL